jgi:hypothetical protein
MTTQEQIDRVLALVSKADPKNGATEAERASALEMANKLREKYGLTKDQLRGKVDPRKPTAARYGHAPHPETRTKFWFNAPMSILDHPTFLQFLQTVDKLKESGRPSIWYDHPSHTFYSYDKALLKDAQDICVKILDQHYRQEALRQEFSRQEFDRKLKAQDAKKKKEQRRATYGMVIFGIVLGVLIGLIIGL